MEKKSICAFLEFLCFLAFAFPVFSLPIVHISQFNNTLFTENISFQTGLNQTRWLPVYKDSSIPNAFLTLKGISTSNTGYVEQQNYSRSTLAVLDSDTSRAAQNKSVSGRWVTGFKVYLSKANSPSGKINLTIRNATDDSILATKYLMNASDLTASIEPYNVSFNSPVYINGRALFSIEFKNDTPLGAFDWVILDRSTEDKASGESLVMYSTSWSNQPNQDLRYVIYFNNTYPTNSWLEVGTPDGTREWNYSNEFNTSQTTSNLSSAIKSALNSKQCDCEGCIKEDANYHFCDFDNSCKITDTELLICVNYWQNGTISDNTLFFAEKYWLEGQGYCFNICLVPFLFHSDTNATLNYSSINVNMTFTDPTIQPIHYTLEENAWGSSSPLTNDTSTSSEYHLLWNISKIGINNLTKTFYYNLTKEIFSNEGYSVLAVYNSTGENISSYSLSEGVIFFNINPLSTSGTHYNKIHVNLTKALYYKNKEAGAGYYYLIEPNFTVKGTVSQYVTISLPSSQRVKSSKYHPEYWVCTNVPTSSFTCSHWSSSVGVTQDNNGNNSINNYPVNLKYYTTNGVFDKISFHANFTSPFLMQVAFTSGGATETSESTQPSGGGGSGGIGYTAEIEQIVNQTLLKQKTCPPGYYLSKDKTQCIPLKTKIEEFEDELLRPRWTIGKWSFGIFSAGLILVSLWAIKGVLNRK